MRAGPQAPGLAGPSALKGFRNSGAGTGGVFAALGGPLGAGAGKVRQGGNPALEAALRQLQGRSLPLLTGNFGGGGHPERAPYRAGSPLGGFGLYFAPNAGRAPAGSGARQKKTALSCLQQGGMKRKGREAPFPFGQWPSHCRTAMPQHAAGNGLSGHRKTPLQPRCVAAIVGPFFAGTCIGEL
jgi:hypothetical protein